MFDTLFRRVPTLEPAVDVDELPFKGDANIYGLHRLPVIWSRTNRHPHRCRTVCAH